MGKIQTKKVKPSRKTFVLDTNVILHDGTCVDNFQEHDIVIPMPVIEELDGFKKGNEEINVNARKFIRRLAAIPVAKLSNGGASLGPGLGRISVALETQYDEKLSKNFSMVKADHRILNCVYVISQKKGANKVVLVTKDLNLQIKAKSLGLNTEDYQHDRISDASHIYAGYRLLENTPIDDINKLYEKPYECGLSQFFQEQKLVENEYLVLKNGNSSALACYDAFEKKIKRVEKRICAGIIPRNSEQTFALNALSNLDIPLNTITGKAGTGKTILALAAALENKKHYLQIFLARPTVPLSNKDIGFLPGDIGSKLDPYMQPLYDNLSVIENSKDNKKLPIKEMLENEKIVITPLSYIRGRSIVKTFFIIDEAQNLTPHEVKTIITRAGEGTKIVFTGDIFQIDHPYLNTQTNGLSFLIERMKGQKMHAHVNLEKGERSELAELASKVL